MTALGSAGPAPSFTPIEALSLRLRAVAPALLGAPWLTQDTAQQNVASEVLDALVAAVLDDLTPPRVWLLLTAVGGRFPDMDEVEEGLRFFALGQRTECSVWLLRTTLATASSSGASLSLELVDGPVVDVSHSAVSDLHTGIQQVVRSTLPRWVEQHDLTCVAWWPDGVGLRRLTPSELARVISWGRTLPAENVSPERVLLVPWGGVLVLPDMSLLPEREPLACLARFSGTPVVGIGYDCIPAVSADLLPPGSAGAFARYLQVIKYMRRIAAISATAAAQFRSFGSALPTQGLTGPAVTECLLGSDPPEARGSAVQTGHPQIACIGSYEPRKNHLGLLHAAELLWREGLDFSLVLVGGMSWTEEIPARIAELQAAGRPLVDLHAVSQEVLNEVYDTSRFTVFPSLHEGYGLPIVESFSHGTPVITSNYGSMAEIAADGGALMIDPRDDNALAAAIRTLLTDDAELDRLRAEILRRPSRSWDDYSADLWEQLVTPELR